MNNNRVEAVEKVWGREELVVPTPFYRYGYCGKRMLLKKGFHSSLHFHIHKHETFFIESGSMILEIKDREGRSLQVSLVRGNSFSIHPGEPHRFYGVEDTVFFEFSSPDSPSDSYRISPSGEGRPAEWGDLEIEE